jgi:short-chain fatty acids transporter
LNNGPAEVKMAPVERVPFISTIATAATRWSTRWVPDAYVIAVILTVIAALLAMIFAKATPFQIVKYWGDGFWVLLTFAMQMCLIILTGMCWPPPHPWDGF